MPPPNQVYWFEGAEVPGRECLEANWTALIVNHSFYSEVAPESAGGLYFSRSFPVLLPLNTPSKSAHILSLDIGYAHYSKRLLPKIDTYTRSGLMDLKSKTCRRNLCGDKNDNG